VEDAKRIVRNFKGKLQNIKTLAKVVQREIIKLFFASKRAFTHLKAFLKVLWKPKPEISVSWKKNTKKTDLDICVFLQWK